MLINNKYKKQNKDSSNILKLITNVRWESWISLIYEIGLK